MSLRPSSQPQARDVADLAHLADDSQVEGVTVRRRRLVVPAGLDRGWDNENEEFLGQLRWIVLWHFACSRGLPTSQE
jgi:hypothetical protein